MDKGRSRQSLQEPFTAERAEIAEPLFGFLCGLGALRGERLWHTQIRWGLALVAAIALICTSPASAQSLLTDRVSVEFASAITSSSPEPTDPFVVLDATATVRITDTLDVIVRPWFRRLPGGDWAKEMYQLQVRYQPSTRIPLRVDAGIISSPLGIIALEMRPDRNPIIGTPSVLLLAAAVVRRPVRSRPAALGRISAGRHGQHLRASMGCARGRDRRHPGAQSQDDVDESPARRAAVRRRRWRGPGGRAPPRRGLRVHGLYRTQTASSLPIPATQSATATVFNLEGEYAIGYTRVAGEWIMDSFETATTPAIARGYLIEAVRTLSPRWYIAGRNTRASTPVYAAGTRVRRTNGTADVTVGYRLSPDILIKVGYQGSRTYVASDWDHAAAISFVFARRFLD